MAQNGMFLFSHLLKRSCSLDGSKVYFETLQFTAYLYNFFMNLRLIQSTTALNRS